jgi:FkbM family methyltransferase
MKPIEFLTRLEAQQASSTVDWESLLELNYLRLLRDVQPLNVIDIGGHAGRHSSVFLDKLHCQTLVIFEPLPAQRQILQAMFGTRANVTLLEIALGNKQTISEFNIKKGAPGESGLKRRSFYSDGNNEDVEIIQVKAELLDSFDLPHRIDYIKMDTEGGEIDILKGGARRIARDLPVMSVEYGPGGYDAYGYGPATLFDWAVEMNYSVYDLFGNRFTARDEWLECVGRFYWDFMLAPNQKASANDAAFADLRHMAWDMIKATTIA